RIFHYIEPDVQLKLFCTDGQQVNIGDTAFEVEAHVHTLLKAERLVLNTMQRMSGIASLTKQYVEKIKDFPCRILDTRKTTPNFRWFEKEAVRIGGGHNHRFGLFDMIMLKDNHIDFCGGITEAIKRTRQYLDNKHLDLRIEVETRNLEEVNEVLQCGGVHRIMLDNFTPSDMKVAVQRIASQFETEASGGITIDSVRKYAETGVQFISVGAMIHHAVSMDLSLKAIRH
ncbi:MAG TPA: carboxylating nicotinate-nucleotide diphosphorylase, partial [Chitinophagaceae bacterium]|nr:carboxylating nicotinate-nucleotide diphosphorylase [Chitinophagaceae bacterium]